MRPSALVRPSTLMPLAVLVCAAAAAGCSTGQRLSSTPAMASPGSDVTTGTLTGQVVYVGGPPPGSPRPMASGGAVTFASTRSLTAAMSMQGRFSAELEPGVYVVTATSPGYQSGAVPCEAVHPVRVVSGKKASVEVYCQLR